jgi:hypothetical protein
MKAANFRGAQKVTQREGRLLRELIRTPRLPLSSLRNRLLPLKLSEKQIEKIAARLSYKGYRIDIYDLHGEGWAHLVSQPTLDGPPPPPARWWRRKPPKERNCYKHKSDALRAFLDYNMPFIDRYANGETYQHGCSEFDSINRKYDIPRSRCARTVVDAVWYALAGRTAGGKGPPYCVRDIDLRTLNETTPGSQGGGFKLPPAVQEELLDEETERYYRRVATEEAGRSDCFITYRKGHGYFSRERPGARGRALLCVCRKNGRFARCAEPPPTDEVPF